MNFGKLLLPCAMVFVVIAQPVSSVGCSKKMVKSHRAAVAASPLPRATSVPPPTEEAPSANSLPGSSPILDPEYFDPKKVIAVVIPEVTPVPLSKAGIESIQFKELVLTSTSSQQRLPAGVNYSSLAKSNGTLYLGSPLYGLFISDDGGVSWRNVRDSDGLAGLGVRNVFAFDDKALVASYGGISLSQDRGKTWTVKGSANGLASDNVYKVYGTGNTIFALAGNYISTSSDGGATWVNKKGSDGLPSNGPNDLFFSDGKLYATYASPAAQVSISADNGSTWQTKNIDGKSYSDLDISVSNGIIYLANSSFVFISRDEGVTWEKKTATDIKCGYLKKNIQTSGGRVQVACNDGGYSESTDNGVTWQRASSLDERIDFISIFDSGHYKGNANGLYISTNQGQSWSMPPVSSSPAYAEIREIFAFENFIYLLSANKGFYFSSDFGKTWVVRDTTNGFVSNSPRSLAVHGSRFVAGTSSGIGVSEDGGVTWKLKNTLSDLSSAYVMSVAFSGDTIYAGTDKGFFVSRDFGGSWTKDVRINGFVSSIVTIGKYVYATNDANGALFISGDEGQNWQKITKVEGLAGDRMKKVAVAGSVIYVATDDGLSLSEDNGATWKILTTSEGLTSNTINSVIADGSNVYVQASNGLSLSSDSGKTWTRVVSAESLAGAHLTGVAASGDKIYLKSLNSLFVNQ